MLLDVKDLTKHYRVSRGGLLGAKATLKAVDGVSFSMAEGETLGLVGESGSGKSTIGQMLLLLTPHTSGSVHFDGQDLHALQKDYRAKLMGKIQAVFQDPYDCLNPKMRVGDIVAEPLRNLGRLSAAEIDRQVAAVIEKVGLRPSDLRKFPHQFSGGQRQRIGIARAISVKPRFIVMDEPVSALDVSVQAQVINLLRDIQRDDGVAYLFISHNLAVVEHLSHRIAILYLGRIVEVLHSENLNAQAAHPYTLSLIDAIPVPDPERVRTDLSLQGEIPSAMDLPRGCAFQGRCAYAQERCRQETPALEDLGAGHLVACHFHRLTRSG
jgi:peptide/nickel transport system ATP-binding protein/oligopeptide transport system ATP-binding protein